MVASLVNAVVGEDASRRVSDSMWKSKRNNALGRVRGKEMLMQMIRDIRGIESTAFQMQSDQWRSLLDYHRYSDTAARQYVVVGGLPHLVRQSFNLYMVLLSKLQAKALEVSGDWESSHAAHLLKHHAYKLGLIRETSFSRRHLILQTYAYLRDANHKDFISPKVLESMVDDLRKRQAPPHQQSNPPLEPPKCQHCRSFDLHAALQRSQVKSSCPFKAHPAGASRRAAPKALELRLQHPSWAISRLVDEALLAVNPEG